MEQSTLISIVMPAYNCEKYIGQAIDSVLMQTYTNWELLVINDASTDSTEEIVKRKQKLNPKIYLYSNNVNLGVSKTRNIGIELANAKWIAFLDSDDMWHPDKLEKQIGILKENEAAQLIYTGSAFIDECGKKAEYILHVPKTVSFQKLLKQNIISCSSVLVNKKKLLNFKMPGDKMHEDYAVWLQMLHEDTKAYGIDEPLLIYRLSSKSKSSNKINAAQMQFRVYRFIGLNILQAVYYMIWYILLNLKKYHEIHKTI